jgi:flagellar basal-body rod modification protein FlgD
MSQVGLTSPLGVFGTFAPASGSGSLSAGGLSQADFLQLLVAQLENQNPLNPVSTDTYVQEMATLAQVQAVEQVAQEVQSLYSLASAQAAVSLLGQTVTVSQGGGGTVTGTVVQVTSGVGGQPQVVLSNGVGYPLSQVTAVGGTGP